jgi:BON domain
MPTSSRADPTLGAQTTYDHSAQAESHYVQVEYDRSAQAGGFIQQTVGAASIAGPYVGRGPRGYMRSEDRTREDVCERLTEHGQIDASNIEVTIENSDVTLNGTVDSLHAKRLAEDTAYSVPFVKEVNNRLRVAVASHSDA